VAKDRITVQEAARRLGVKDDAVRKRIQRGSIGHDKDSDGRVYVYLDTTHDESQDASKDTTGYVPRTDHPANGRIQDGPQDAAKDGSWDALVEAKDETIVELRDQVGFLRRELERKDTIIMSLTQRIPELEAPRATAPEATPEATGAPDTGSEGVGRGEDHHPVERPSWWRKFFGLE
jgi:excisionase family DNA binding protein